MIMQVAVPPGLAVSAALVTTQPSWTVVPATPETVKVIWLVEPPAVMEPFEMVQA
jgi:hypothetical protein